MARRALPAPSVVRAHICLTATRHTRAVPLARCSSTRLLGRRSLRPSAARALPIAQCDATSSCGITASLPAHCRTCRRALHSARQEAVDSDSGRDSEGGQAGSTRHIRATRPMLSRDHAPPPHGGAGGGASCEPNVRRPVSHPVRAVGRRHDTQNMADDNAQCRQQQQQQQQQQPDERATAEPPSITQTADSDALTTAHTASSSSSTPLALTPLSAPLALFTPVPLPFSVRWCVAPMVGASDLCFRMLTRRHGASVCYTPMLHADRMNDDAYFQAAVDFAHPTRNGAEGEDRPLIAQFAANDPAQLLAASLRVQPFVDAVDLNLGCPQASAFEGRFGSFLLSRRQWPLVARMVRTLRAHLTVPVMAKIRLLATHEETRALCILLIASGCSAIAIHGRQRGSDKRRRAGAADLQAIARLRAELPPECTIIANGNIRCLEDAHANLLTTRCEGVMSAEAVLANPRLFAAAAASAPASSPLSDASSTELAPSSSAPSPPPCCLSLSQEYLSLCEEYPSPPASWLSNHVHNFCRRAIADNHWMDLKAQIKNIGRERTGAGDRMAEVKNGDNAQQADDSASSSASPISANSPSPAASFSSRCDDLPGTLVRLRALLAELERRLAEVGRTGNPHAQLQRERKQKREETQRDDDSEVPVDLYALAE